MKNLEGIKALVKDIFKEVNEIIAKEDYYLLKGSFNEHSKCWEDYISDLMSVSPYDENQKLAEKGEMFLNLDSILADEIAKDLGFKYKSIWNNEERLTGKEEYYKNIPEKSKSIWEESIRTLDYKALVSKNQNYLKYRKNYFIPI